MGMGEIILNTRDNTLDVSEVPILAESLGAKLKQTLVSAGLGAGAGRAGQVRSVP